MGNYIECNLFVKLCKGLCGKVAEPLLRLAGALKVVDQAFNFCCLSKYWRQEKVKDNER